MQNKFILLIALLFPPCRFKNFLLRSLGWTIEEKVSIGFSFIYVQKVFLGKGSSIGHGNFIKINSLYLGKKAYIQKLNQITGPLIVYLKEKAGIGNQNKIVRAKHPISWGHSMLKLGNLSKITSKHTIDCMRPVVLGDYSILAGYGSQLWTHGFVHAPQGADRYRVDGSIKIGNNVYVGSGSTINPGIKVVDSVTIGTSSSVSKSLTESGFYVSQPLRLIEFNYEDGFKKYPSINVSSEVGKVILKKI